MTTFGSHEKIFEESLQNVFFMEWIISGMEFYSLRYIQIKPREKCDNIC